MMKAELVRVIEFPHTSGESATSKIIGGWKVMKTKLCQGVKSLCAWYGVIKLKVGKIRGFASGIRTNNEMTKSSIA